MNVIYGSGNLVKGAGDPKVLTVGVFDGVHRGHQSILRRVVREAKRRGLKSAVLTFAVHPSHTVHRDKKIPHLTSLEHKLALIECQGIDLCYVVDFRKSFAALPAESFVRHYLVGKMEMVSLYIGEDFAFGQGAKGDRRLLERLAGSLSFQLHVVKHRTFKNRIISSTWIRRLIQAGDLDRAKACLGRDVSVWGSVVSGEGRGRTLGFPTANLAAHHEVLPPDGIYATYAFCRQRRFKSVTYVGTKPTFHPYAQKRSIEVFLFGTRENFYGQTMEVRFVRRLRGDRRFSSPEALVSQIKADIGIANKVLNKKTP